MSFVGSPVRALNSSFSVPGEGHYQKRQGFALIGQPGAVSGPSGVYDAPIVSTTGGAGAPASSLLPGDDVRSSASHVHSEAPAHHINDGGGPLGLLHPTRMSILTLQLSTAMIRRTSPSTSATLNPSSQGGLFNNDYTPSPVDLNHNERGQSGAPAVALAAPAGSPPGSISGGLASPLMKRVGSYFGSKLAGSAESTARAGSLEVTKPPKAASIMDTAGLDRLESDSGGVFVTGSYSIMCYNYGETLCFNELSARSPEPFYSIAFKSPPCSHNMSPASDGSGLLRLLVGCVNGEFFSSVDLPLAEILFRGGVGFSFSHSNQAHNVDGQLSSSRVIMTEWIPGSPSRFVVVHMEGVIAVYDTRFKSPTRGRSESEGGGGTGTGGGTSNGISESTGIFPVGKKSTGGSTPADVTVWRQVKGRKANPVLVIRLPMACINAASLCPTSTEAASNPLLLAIAGRDGFVRIVDMTNEVLLVSFQSYCGAFLCVSWSPDGRYIATGGEDDLVSIFCPAEFRTVVRCEGHSSWVSSVWWDESMCKNGRYRLGSAGQDTKLLLWDFEKEGVHLRPSQRTVKSRADSQTVVSNPTGKVLRLPRPFRSGLITGGASDGPGTNHSRNSSSDVPSPIIVPAAGRAEIPILEPAVSHYAHNEPLTDIKFGPDGVLTACSMGLVKLWGRPPVSKVPPLELSRDIADE